MGLIIVLSSVTVLTGIWWDKEMEPFFITGLPRSRTAWLANLFSYENSFCFHEALRECTEIKDIKKIFNGVDKQYVGDSDSGLPFFIDEVLDLFPESKLVLVNRGISEVIDSLGKVFPNYPEIEKIVIKTQNAINDMVNKYKPFILDFEDLNDMGVCKLLWEYCIPGIVFDERRWRMLDLMNVEVNISKYMNSLPEPATKLMKEKILCQ